MANLKNGESVDSVLDVVFQKAKENKDPFNPPVFVFAQKQNCEWFKMHLLRKLEDGALFNLKISTLEDFVISYLLDRRNGNNKDAKLFDAEKFRDLICRKLLSKEKNDQCYYRNKSESEEGCNRRGWDKVGKFIESHVISDGNESKINYLNLYDLAKTLGRLFFEYSVDMPNTPDGSFRFVEAFKEGKFPKNKISDNTWQSDLYADVRKMPESENLKTLYDLFSEMNDDFPELKTDVYFFSCSGKGSDDNIPSFYVQVIESIEKRHNGERNGHKLHRVNLNDIFGSESKKHKETDKFGSLISAPSKIREIEGVHGEICKLLASGSVENLDDILILAPDANEYRTSIHQVFSVAKGGGKDCPYPYVPVDMLSLGFQSDMAKSLKALLEVAEKGYYTRSDFFAIANSSLVRTKFNIDSETIDSFCSAIDKLSVYRDRPAKKDDWQRAAYRSLLHVLMDGSLYDENSSEEEGEAVHFVGEGEGGDYRPFSIIGFGNEELAAFSGLINALEGWCGLFAGFKETADAKNVSECSYDSNDARSIAECLQELFDIGSKIKEEDVANESAVYRAVISKLNTLFDAFGNGNKIPHQILKFMLLDSMSDITLDDSLSIPGTVRVSSFSFASPIMCKYLFLIGMNSNGFSISKDDNVLDIRGDDFAKAVQERKTNVLKSQMKLADKVWVSFVDRDLKKDEDFYLAPEIAQALKSELDIDVYAEPRAASESNPNSSDSLKKLELKIDEDRDDSELWTAREFRMKRIGEMFGQTEGGMMPDSKKQIVKISDIKKFLTDPFQFYVKGLFGEKWGGNVQKDTFEPVEFDNITKADVSKRIIRAMLTDPSADECIIKEKVLRECANIPDGKFRECALDDVCNDVKEFCDKIKEKVTGCIELNKKIDCVVDGKSVIGTYSMHNSDWNDVGKDLYVFDYTSDILNSYITMLCLVASSDVKNKKYHLFCKGIKNSKEGEVAAEGARKKLSEIIGLMGDKKHCGKCIPFKIISDEKECGKIKEIDDLKKRLDGSQSPWEFFDDKKLFDPETDCGYTRENFSKEWEEASKRQRNLFLFLAEKSDKAAATQN